MTFLTVALALSATACGADSSPAPDEPPATAATPGAGNRSAEPGGDSTQSGGSSSGAPRKVDGIPKLTVAGVKAAWVERWRTEAVDLGTNHWSVKVAKPALSMMVTGKPDSPDEVWGIVCYQTGTTKPDAEAATKLAEDCLRDAVDDPTFDGVLAWLEDADYRKATLRKQFPGFTGRLNLDKTAMSLALTGGDTFPA